MKKILIFAGVFLSLGFAAHAFAADGFTALAPIPGLTDTSATSVVSQNGFAAFFNQLYKYCIGLAATLAVIEIIWGGLEISTKDSVSKQSEGRERITQAIFGLVLVLSPVLVFSIINPSILNLSINIPKLDTTAPAPTGAGTGQPLTFDAAISAATSAGCTVSKSEGTVAVSCPNIGVAGTNPALTNFANACPSGPAHLSIDFSTSGNTKASCDSGTPPPAISGKLTYWKQSQIQSGQNLWCYGDYTYASGSKQNYIVCETSKASCENDVTALEGQALQAWFQCTNYK
jgi:hypothetical protein